MHQQLVDGHSARAGHSGSDQVGVIDAGHPPGHRGRVDVVGHPAKVPFSNRTQWGLSAGEGHCSGPADPVGHASYQHSGPTGSSRHATIPRPVRSRACPTGSQRRSVARPLPIRIGDRCGRTGRVNRLGRRPLLVAAAAVATTSPRAHRRIERASGGSRALVERTPVGAVVTGEAHLARGLSAHPSSPERLRRQPARQSFGQHRPVFDRSSFHYSSTLLVRLSASRPKGFHPPTCLPAPGSGESIGRSDRKLKCEDGRRKGVKDDGLVWSFMAPTPRHATPSSSTSDRHRSGRPG
jgi:hypothetical protein